MTNHTDTITGIADGIVAGARTVMDLTGMTDTAAAIDIVAQSFISDAERALARTGIYRYETTAADIESVLFRGSVARDVMDNTFRPSSGPVRDYVIASL